MSAAQVAGTPAAPPAPPATEPVTAAAHGIDAILAEITPEEVGAAGDKGGEEILDALAGDKPAATDEEEQKPQGAEKEPSANLDEMLFSDEALSTAEGVKKGADRLRALRHQQREAYLQLKGFAKNVESRKAKLDHKIATFKSEKATHDLLLNNVRSNLQGLHSGDPEVILTALGNLTGTDGVKAYELLTSRIVNRGDKQIDPQIKQLLEQQKSEIQQLRQEREAERRQVEIQQGEAQIANHKQVIGQMVRASTTTPHLTRLYNENPTRLTEAIVSTIIEDNGATPAPALFAQMEAELQQHFGAAPQQGTNGGTVQQPQRAQRSPGQSIGPRTAVAATTREPSEKEALEALARDPDVLSALGLA